MTKYMNMLEKLPQELIIKIQYYLPTIKDCINFSETCIYLSKIISPEIRWRPRIKEYPELLINQKVLLMMSKDVNKSIFEIKEYDYDIKKNNWSKLTIDFKKCPDLQKICKEILISMVQYNNNIDDKQKIIDKLMKNDLVIELKSMPSLTKEFVRSIMFIPMMTLGLSSQIEEFKKILSKTISHSDKNCLTNQPFWSEHYQL